MFGSAKYIVLDRWGHATDAMIIFPASMNHSAVAKNFGGRENVLSAGFICVENGKFRCHGRSQSLGIGSSENDDLLVKIMMGI
jgi:hypothetical protein